MQEPTHKRDAGLMAELVEMQDRENAIRATMTTEQKAQRSKEQLKAIPAQRYLFAKGDGASHS